eukprot:364802-Chlamydomonas_euryale.AAC.7
MAFVARLQAAASAVARDFQGVECGRHRVGGRTAVPVYLISQQRPHLVSRLVCATRGDNTRARSWLALRRQRPASDTDKMAHHTSSPLNKPSADCTAECMQVHGKSRRRRRG